MMVGFFEEAEGVKSMGRIQVFIGTLIGAALAIYGAITKQDYLVYAGLGMIGVEGGVKAVQKMGEK
jgi:hypothetical protein